MSKTTFVNGDPSQGIAGTVVTAEFLNKVNNHYHTGRDVDGEGALAYAADTGEADAYIVTLSPALDAYITGMPIWFKAENANTGASTININELGTKTIKKNGGIDLEVGDIKSGQMVEVVYDGTNFQLLSAIILPVPSGLFRNLQASASGSNANISVSADEITLDSKVSLQNVAVSIDTATSGANGLDTGSLAASTWYAVWIISKDDGTVAGMISLSGTAPTMPSGYTHKARVSWIRTDNTANKYPLSFKQFGRKVQYVVASGTNLTSPRVMSSGSLGDTTTPVWVSVSVSNFVPSTASRIVLIVANLSANSAIIVAPNNKYGGKSDTANNPPPILVLRDTDTTGNSVVAELLLESTNIYVASNGGAQAAVYAMGWEDNL